MMLSFHRDVISGINDMARTKYLDPGGSRALDRDKKALPKASTRRNWTNHRRDSAAFLTGLSE